MISTHALSSRLQTPQNVNPIGISAISSFLPSWTLPNEWFDAIPRKFVKHTGILERRVATQDEVSLAVCATKKLVAETGCDLEKCAAIIFTAPSFVPMTVAHDFMDHDRACEEQLDRAADRFVDAIGIKPRRVVSFNTFCAGYASALSVVKEINQSLELARDEFVLILTSTRISRITDYSCRDTSGLFGDLATATIISRLDSDTYPVHFELLDAQVEQQVANRPFLKFSLRNEVLTPTIEGGQRFDPQRVVFSLDGMGIAEVAPRAMTSAATQMVQEINLEPKNIQHIVPHQAGSAIVRLAEMRLRDAGFTADVTNGMTAEVGNTSACSIPHTLKTKWNQLGGNILCPIASVGPPHENTVAQGCIALRSTPIHNPIGKN